MCFLKLFLDVLLEIVSQSECLECGAAVDYCHHTATFPPSSDFNGAEEGTQRRAKRLNRVKVGRRLTGGWVDWGIDIKRRDCQE